MTNQSRRQFLLIITAGAATLGVAACGGGGGGGNKDAGGNQDGGGSTDCSTVTSTIAANHTPPHAVTIVEADVAAGESKTFTFTDGGVGPHSHMITLSASMFADLAAGKTIMTVSTTTSAHTHQVSVRCAG